MSIDRRRNVIPQSKRLEPYHQGALDYLCGLYSAINAIRLTAYPTKRLTKYYTQYLMEDGIEYLDRGKHLSIVLKEGMSFSLRIKLTDHLIKRMNQRWGLIIRKSHPNLNADLFEFIEREVDKGHPVCIHVDGLHDHYTVICGYTPSELKLHDSDGLQYFRRNSISFKGDRLGLRHQLIPTGVFSLSVVKTPIH